MTGPATAVARTEAGESQSRERRLGLLLGFLGVAAFSLSLPVTRRAVQEIDATFVAFGRMALAGLAAAILLALRRPPFPARRDLPALATVAGGVVLGFPLFSTLAMREVDASHGGVVLAILPLATAAAGALLAGERPSARFWVAAGAGGLLVLAFAFWRSRGAPGGRTSICCSPASCAPPATRRAGSWRGGRRGSSSSPGRWSSPCRSASRWPCYGGRRSIRRRAQRLGWRSSTSP